MGGEKRGAGRPLPTITTNRPRGDSPERENERYTCSSQLIAQFTVGMGAAGEAVSILRRRQQGASPRQEDCLRVVAAVLACGLSMISPQLHWGAILVF